MTVELNLFLQNILQRRCDMVPFERLCDPAAHRGRGTEGTARLAPATSVLGAVLRPAKPSAPNCEGSAGCR